MKTTSALFLAFLVYLRSVMIHIEFLYADRMQLQPMVSHL